MIFELVALSSLVYVLATSKKTVNETKNEREVKKRLEKYPINIHVHLNNVSGMQTTNGNVSGQNAVRPDLKDHLGLTNVRGSNVGQNTGKLYGLLVDRMAQAEKSVPRFVDNLLKGGDLGQTHFVDGSVVRVRMPVDFDPRAIAGRRYVRRG